MAFFPTILSNNDPIIGMTRTLNVLLAQTAASQIRAVLNDHAFPRIRMRILSATKAKQTAEGGSNEGVSVWFDDLSDMATPATQAAVEALINTMISTQPLMRDAVYSIAAKMAASVLTNQLAAQVKPQAEYAIELDKQAIQDLEKLIRTPFFDGTVSAVKETKLKEGKLARIYLALDINDDVTTYNATTNEGQVYTGAQVAGRAMLWTGWKSLDNIEVVVNVGDTPAKILYNLQNAWRNAQTAKDAGSISLVPAVIAADEGVPVVGTRTTQFKTYPGATPTGPLQTPAVNTNLAFLAISPYLYDKQIDFLNVTLQLWSETTLGSLVFDKQGIPGLLYGIEPYYSGLTKEGPHSVIIDLETGEKSTLTTPTTTEEKALSDTFYFELSDPGEAAYGLVNISGVITTGDQFDVVLGGVTYSYTALIGDGIPEVITGLIALIDPLVNFIATSPTAGQLRINYISVGVLGNSVTLTVATTSLTGFITASGLTLTNGRDVNTLPNNDVVRFRSQEMVDTLNTVPVTVARERTINVSKGMTILQIVNAIANDIAQFSATSRLLGALRAPTKFIINGTPYAAPGLTIVPYTRDEFHYNVVFDMQQVPAAVKFAAMPKSMITDVPGTWDNLPKSLVIPAKFFNPTSTSGLKKAISETDKGKMYISEPKTSSRMKKVFDAIDKFNKDFE